MALLHILEYPDPRLHKIAAKVTMIDDTIQKLIDDMTETMYAAPGIGLAATQVDVHLQIIVMDLSDTHDELRVLINPEILASSGEAVYEEGCLSVPGYYDKVQRAEWVRIRTQNRDGKTYEFEADGLLAVCVQHEMDHLNGKVFVERLSPLKQQRYKAKLIKQKRAHVF